jgi:hypothetical protein
MAKGAPKATGALPKSTAAAPAAPKSAAAAPAAPKTTGSTGPAPKANQKQAAGQPADIGDICLLPDIARFAH